MRDLPYSNPSYDTTRKKVSDVLRTGTYGAADGEELDNILSVYEKNKIDKLTNAATVKLYFLEMVLAKGPLTKAPNHAPNCKTDTTHPLSTGSV